MSKILSIQENEDPKGAISENEEQIFEEECDQDSLMQPSEQADDRLEDSGDDQTQRLEEKLLSQRSQFRAYLEELGDYRMLNFKIDELKKEFNIRLKEMPKIDVLIKMYDKDIQQMLVTRSEKRNWNEDDITILLWIVCTYAVIKSKNYKEFNDNDWQLIGALVPGKNSKKCKLKLIQMQKYTCNSSAWTSEENTQLRELVSKFGQKKWCLIAQKMYLSSQQQSYRTPKQCREHYNKWLDPFIKRSAWSREEDLELLRLTKEKGQQWSEINQLIVSRTQNALKNRYHSLLKKEAEFQCEQYDQREGTITSEKLQNDYFSDIQKEYSLINQMIANFQREIYQKTIPEGQNFIGFCEQSQLSKLQLVPVPINPALSDDLKMEKNTHFQLMETEGNQYIEAQKLQFSRLLSQSLNMQNKPDGQRNNDYEQSNGNSGNMINHVEQTLPKEKLDLSDQSASSSYPPAFATQTPGKKNSSEQRATPIETVPNLANNINNHHQITTTSSTTINNNPTSTINAINKLILDVNEQFFPMKITKAQLIQDVLLPPLLPPMQSQTISNPLSAPASTGIPASTPVNATGPMEIKNGSNSSTNSNSEIDPSTRDSAFSETTFQILHQKGIPDSLPINERMSISMSVINWVKGEIYIINEHIDPNLYYRNTHYNLTQNEKQSIMEQQERKNMYNQNYNNNNYPNHDPHAYRPYPPQNPNYYQPSGPQMQNPQGPGPAPIPHNQHGQYPVMNNMYPPPPYRMNPNGGPMLPPPPPPPPQQNIPHDQQSQQMQARNPYMNGGYPMNSPPHHQQYGYGPNNNNPPLMQGGPDPQSLRMAPPNHQLPPPPHDKMYMQRNDPPMGNQMQQNYPPCPDNNPYPRNYNNYGINPYKNNMINSNSGYMRDMEMKNMNDSNNQVHNKTMSSQISSSRINSIKVEENLNDSMLEV